MLRDSDATADAAAPRRRLSRTRRATVKSMLASAAIPQFVLERDVDIARAIEHRETARGAGSLVTISDLLTAACAVALRRHPVVNGRYDEGHVLLSAHVNVGLALATDDGLVLAAITDADQRGLEELATERRRLAAAARDGGLTVSELYDSTFVISNLGPLGVDRFTALVTPPLGAILAVGRARQTSDGPRLSLSLSCDHRLIDGAPAARFLADVVATLEAPVEHAGPRAES